MSSNSIRGVAVVGRSRGWLENERERERRWGMTLVRCGGMEDGFGWEAYI
jgi:hypothetical protein